jgi:hypothetical protein
LRRKAIMLLPSLWSIRLQAPSCNSPRIASVSGVSEEGVAESIVMSLAKRDALIPLALAATHPVYIVPEPAGATPDASQMEVIHGQDCTQVAHRGHCTRSRQCSAPAQGRLRRECCEARDVKP